MSSFIKNNAIPYKIIAFKASENLKACRQFVRAHQNELKKIGITNIASSDPSWLKDPNVLVFSLINLRTNKPVAGMKIDIWHKEKSIPIIRSLAHLDNKMSEIVSKNSDNGIAEICGLWVSDEVSGFGVSKILIRSALSTFSKLGIGKSIAFASQYTFKTISCMGFEVYSEIGDNGMFLYPTKDFKSYVALLHDTEKFGGAQRKESRLILELQRNPLLMRLENEKQKNLLVQYDLRITKERVKSMSVS